MDNKIINFLTHSKEEAAEVTDVFSSMFSLNEEDFKIISEAFLIEYVRAFDNNEIRRTTIEQINKELIEQELTLSEYREKLFKILNDSQNKQELKSYHIDFLKKIFTVSLNVYEESMYNKEKSITIPIELMEGGILPKYATKNDAGADIYLPEDVNIGPGERKIIKVKFKTAIPEGYAILVQPRSGLSAKTGLRVANTPGLVDSGYRDEYGIIIENIEPNIKNIIYDFDDKNRPVIQAIEHGSSYSLTKGDRIAQLRLVAAPQINWKVVDSVANIGEDRGGGFGHTGE